LKAINKQALKKYVGRYIQVKQADGTVVKGKLVAVDNQRVYIKPLQRKKGKAVTSNWIIGLFLVGIVFVGLIAFWGWGGGGGCYKPCCGAPCNRPCGCKHRHHRRHHRRKKRYNSYAY